MAALRFWQLSGVPIVGPITFGLGLHFGQEMLPKSCPEQGNFPQGVVKDDPISKIPAAVLTRLNCLPFNVDYLAE
jgi:hypothetical protein